MPLYINTSGYPGDAFMQLIAIVRCDGGLGQQNDTARNLIKVTYAQKVAGIGSDLIARLVAAATGIMITAVDSNFLLPDGTPITARAGMTLIDQNGQVYCFFDSTQDNEIGYCVRDAYGNFISIPPPVMLLHELSHAYHVLNGDDSEWQARADENQFRYELGLTLRDPDSEELGYGCINGETVPPCTGTTADGTGTSKGSGHCFIVGAALGRKAAVAVADLKTARDGAAARSGLVARFMAQLMGEYYLFSADIAATMKRLPAFRKSIYDWCVKPLLEYSPLFEAYAASGGECTAFLERAEHLFKEAASRCTSLAGGVSEVAGEASKLARQLRTGKVWPLGMRGRAFQGDSESPADVFEFLGRSILADRKVSEVDHIAWAANALAVYWSTAADMANGPLDERGLANWREAVCEWLAATPLPLAGDLSPSMLVAELSRFKSSIFVDRVVRLHIGKRIRDRGLLYGDETAQAALRAAGYLPEDI